MYSHALILTVLSAGALAVNTTGIFITAFAPTDTACTGDAAGNNISLADALQPPTHGYQMSPCIPYAPEHGQLVHFDFPDDDYFFIFAFSEANCQNETAIPLIWSGDPKLNCFPMVGDAHVDEGSMDWKSVQLQLLQKGS